jgi:hypothetical protein
MDIILIVVTALSLAIAVGMAIVVVTMLRQERARSDARIEVLSALAAEPMPAVAEPVHRSTHFSAEQIAQWREGARPAERVARAAEPEPSPRVVAQPTVVRQVSDGSADDLEIRPAVAGVAELFAEPERSSPWVNRLVAIGCFAAIVLAIGIALNTLGSHTKPVTAAGPTQAAAKAEVPPLELLSLRHTQEQDRIVITGIVQNPKTAAAVAHVAATVFVFGPDGAFLSSNQAPLDYTTLTPGGESQFVVSVPVTGQVARYRVGFRTEDGHVLPHVDKRSPDALAQK